jgi:hypothetical protein
MDEISQAIYAKDNSLDSVAVWVYSANQFLDRRLLLRTDSQEMKEKLLQSFPLEIRGSQIRPFSPPDDLAKKSISCLTTRSHHFFRPDGSIPDSLKQEFAPIGTILEYETSHPYVNSDTSPSIRRYVNDGEPFSISVWVASIKDKPVLPLPTRNNSPNLRAMGIFATPGRNRGNCHYCGGGHPRFECPEAPQCHKCGLTTHDPKYCNRKTPPAPLPPAQSSPKVPPTSKAPQHQTSLSNTNLFSALATDEDTSVDEEMIDSTKPAPQPLLSEDQQITVSNEKDTQPLPSDDEQMTETTVTAPQSPAAPQVSDDHQPKHVSEETYYSARDFSTHHPSPSTNENETPQTCHLPPPSENVTPSSSSTNPDPPSLTPPVAPSAPSESSRQLRPTPVRQKSPRRPKSHSPSKAVPYDKEIAGKRSPTRGRKSTRSQSTRPTVPENAPFSAEDGQDLQQFLSKVTPHIQPFNLPPPTDHGPPRAPGEQSPPPPDSPQQLTTNDPPEEPLTNSQAENQSPQGGQESISPPHAPDAQPNEASSSPTPTQY